MNAHQFHRGEYPCSATSRRGFLRYVGGAIASGAACRAEDEELRVKIDSFRPSNHSFLAPELRSRVGATHVDGKYHRTDKPNLIEGAEELLRLGTRLGKFWFDPRRAHTDYAVNSTWPHMASPVELAASPYWREVFRLPFRTLILNVHSDAENGWQHDTPDSMLVRVEQEMKELTLELYRQCKENEVTIILQHWEGDWLLRGTGATWNPPPADWQERCQRMVRWLGARQAGVEAGRKAAPPQARCRVVHAAEVNRVRDDEKGIPTVMRNVLPDVVLDAVSYSCYDAMEDGPTLFRAVEKLRKFARTTGVLGSGAVYVGEVGIPENIAPDRIEDRWDELMGAMLAVHVTHIVQWQLYCNEVKPERKSDVGYPVKDPDHLRGFWLVLPDGSLSRSGKWFSAFWEKCR